jgi:hypothetical protein
MTEHWIYERAYDNKARFLLGEKGDRTLICIGINPSTAEPGKLDNTLRSVKRFSKDLHYDSWMMLNVYPQRATDPNKLHDEIDPKYHAENLGHIRSFLRSGTFDIWAAWGRLITKRPYLSACLHDIVAIAREHLIDWYTVGKTTKAGHPHHPLYLRKTLGLAAFNINEYLQNVDLARAHGAETPCVITETDHD